MKARGLVFGVMVGALCLMGVGMLGNSCGAPAETRLSEAFTNQVVINAPPGQVWAYMFVDTVKLSPEGVASVEWIPEWTCRDVKGTPGQVGLTCRSTVEAVGKKFEQDYVAVEIVPNQKFSQRDSGDVDDSLTYLLIPEGAGTRLIVIWDYAMDIPPGVTKESLAQAMKKITVDAGDRIKQKVEAGPPSASAKPTVQAVAAAIVSSSIVIAAPPEKIFPLLADPTKQGEWDPDFGGCGPVEGSGIGTNCPWKEKFGEQMLEGWQVITDLVPNQKVVWVNTGDSQNTWTSLLVPVTGGTKVIMVMDFALPPSLQAKLPPEMEMEAAMKGFLDGNLARLKAAMEKPAAPPAPPKEEVK